jgi:hypothetical protein
MRSAVHGTIDLNHRVDVCERVCVRERVQGGKFVFIKRLYPEGHTPRPPKTAAVVWNNLAGIIASCKISQVCDPEGPSVF